MTKQHLGPGSTKDKLEAALEWNAAAERHGRIRHDSRVTSRDRGEAQIDEGLDETYPASDPPAFTTPVRTGTHRPPGK